MSLSLLVRRVPWTVVAGSFALMGIGLAAVMRGDQMAGGAPLWPRQLAWILLAAGGMFAATLRHYRAMRGVSYPFFLVCATLLALVYLTPARNGAHRWIPLGPANLQPSEPTKLAFILALANYLIHRRNYRTLRGLLFPFAMAVVPAALILREPDLGTALVFFPVLFAMLFAAGARPRHLLLIGVLGVGLLPVMWLGMNTEQKSRIVTLFVQRDGGPAPAGDGYHLHQSKQVLALGGIWGSRLAGMPLDDPLAYHLPAARTDFVFCLVGERFGMIGGCATLLVYAIVFASGLRVAAGTREPFGRLLAVGVVALVATQTVINAGMTVGLMPVTGITLPLISHGGSSLLTMSVAVGMLLNVGMRPGYEVAPDPFQFGRPV